MPAKLNSKEIKSLLSRELELCKRLRAMVSREIEAIVRTGDMEELLEIIRKKEPIIAQLQLIADSWEDILADAGISNINDDTSDTGVNDLADYFMATWPDDTELVNLFEDTRDSMRELVNAEETAQTELEKFLDDLRGQMASMSRGQNAAISYMKMGGGLIR